MWDAKQLTAEFSPDDVRIEDTDACNDRMRRERARANEALAPVSSDSTVCTSASHLCIMCGAAAAPAAGGPWYSAHTVREDDKSSAVTTKHTTTKVTVDTIPAPGGRATTTTETTTITDTTTTITKYITTTTVTTRTVDSVYPLGLVPALHTLYDRCTRACGSLVVCSTCGLAVCVLCIVTHFPFEVHCDLIPITRATSPYHWLCPRCDEPPPLGTPLSPPPENEK